MSQNQKRKRESEPPLPSNTTWTIREFVPQENMEYLDEMAVTVVRNHSEAPQLWISLTRLGRERNSNGDYEVKWQSFVPIFEEDVGELQQKLGKGYEELRKPGSTAKWSFRKCENLLTGRLMARLKPLPRMEYTSTSTMLRVMDAKEEVNLAKKRRPRGRATVLRKLYEIEETIPGKSGGMEIPEKISADNWSKPERCSANHQMRPAEAYEKNGKTKEWRVKKENNTWPRSATGQGKGKPENFEEYLANREVNLPFPKSGDENQSKEKDEQQTKTELGESSATIQANNENTEDLDLKPVARVFPWTV